MNNKKPKPKQPTMRNIPHIDQINDINTLKKLIQDATEQNIEISEKIDGVNISFATDGKNTITKSKRAKPTTDPNFFYKLQKKIPVFKAMGDITKVLNLAGFPKWLSDIETKYKTEICKTADISVEDFNGIVFFCEILFDSQTNTLIYSKDNIGNGAITVFGCVVKSDTTSGIDISTSDIGISLIRKFVDVFNNIDGWKFYYKQIVNLKISEMFIKALQGFVDKHGKELSAKAKTPEGKKRKEEIQDNLIKILTAFKLDLLKQGERIKSMLGAKEIEGLVLRNKQTGEITKIVDRDKFTTLNQNNWAGNREFRDRKREFIKEIHTTIFKNADIFRRPKKQEEKLGDYLLDKNKDKFDDISEILAVFYEDAKSEVEFDNIRDIIANFNNITNKYLDDLTQFKQKYEELQDTDKKMSPHLYKSVMYEVSEDESQLNNILNTLVQKAKHNNPIEDIISYVLGDKAIENLSNQFL